MATKKTGTAAKPKLTTQQKAAIKGLKAFSKANAGGAAPAKKAAKPKGQTTSSGVRKAKTVKTAGPGNASAGGGKGNKKTATAKVGGATSRIAPGTAKASGGSGTGASIGAPARGAKGTKYAGGTNATGGGP